METTAVYYRSLLQRYLGGQATAEETRTLFDYLDNHPQPKLLLQHLDVEFQIALQEKRPVSDVIRHRIKERLMQEITEQQPAPTRRIHFLKTTWLRYAAAILLIFGAGAYFYFSNTSSNIVQHTDPIPMQNDALPGSDKAILTLADGQQIQLDSSANHLLATKGIENDNATIIYSGSGEANAINTLATPKGGQYKIRLSDGTMVWLNAASSITYPTVFTEKERKVFITGEVYFEVAKDRSKPFRVNVNDLDVEVLGTHFNINSYDDESSIKTTLLEGSVQVNHSNRKQILQPHQQAVVSDGKLAVEKVNTQEVVAWKNGLFNFQDIKVDAAMRQLARWYDIEIQYDGKVPDGDFGGKMDRNLNLSQVLKVLDGVGVGLKLEGRVLHVKPL